MLVLSSTEKWPADLGDLTCKRKAKLHDESGNAFADKRRVLEAVVMPLDDVVVHQTRPLDGEVHHT